MNEYSKNSCVATCNYGGDSGKTNVSRGDYYGPIGVNFRETGIQKIRLVA